MSRSAMSRSPLFEIADHPIADHPIAAVRDRRSSDRRCLRSRIADHPIADVRDRRSPITRSPMFDIASKVFPMNMSPRMKALMAIAGAGLFAMFVAGTQAQQQAQGQAPAGGAQSYFVGGTPSRVPSDKLSTS